MTRKLDLSRAPLGEIAAHELVSAVVEGDDRLERHYLEIKSDLDLTKKNDLAKIAKYILGSANRLPEVAADAFEGYGVMIIGVAPGSMRGVPPIEVLEISKVVRQYLGASGPRWDVIRVPVEGSDNEVLIIVVDPPQPGQAPFPCRRDGDGLTDGRIYVRADGETREAKADELDRLVARGAQQQLLDVAFDVTVEGAAYSLELDEAATLEVKISRETQRLLDALPRPTEPSDETVDPLGAEAGPASASLRELAAQGRSIAEMASEMAAFNPAGLSSLMKTTPEKRSEEEYRASIQEWESRYRSQWSAVVDAVTGHVLVGIGIRVKNLTKIFFQDAVVKIHLEGEVRGVEWVDGDLRHLDTKLPNPPRPWGPFTRSVLPDLSFPIGGDLMPNLYTQSTYRSPLDWNNTGSVDLELDVGDLRPMGEFVFDDPELVLVLPRGSVGPVRGNWELTARGHHDVYGGTLEVPVLPSPDLSPELAQVIGISEVDD